MALQPWKIISSTYPFKNKWVTIRQDTIRLPSGKVIEDYFVREFDAIITVFAVTAEGKVIVNRQYKHGAGEVVTELPAGMADAGETPLAAAQRELREEAGYGGGEWEEIAVWHVSPTGASGKRHLFLCRGAVPVGGKVVGDSREEIENDFWTLEHLRAAVFSGEINAEPTVAAILYGLERVGS